MSLNLTTFYSTLTSCVIGLFLLLSLGAAQSQSSIARIAFASNRDGDFEIFVMDGDGTNVTQLTFNTASDGTPVWSPDGSRIAFASNRDGNKEVYVMNDDGTNQTRLTTSTGEDIYPAWSPDGAKIAFYSTRDGGNREIYVMNADGSNQANLSNHPSADRSPSWSPDGSKIAFTSERGGARGIWVMDADGNNPVRLFQSGTSDGPCWSPDGRKIVFMTDRDLTSAYQLYVINSDGTNDRRLTFSNANEETIAQCWSWQPGLIAFSSDRDGNNEIYLWNNGGTNQIRLTNNSADDRQPSWSTSQAVPALSLRGVLAFTFLLFGATGLVAFRRKLKG